MHQKQRIELIIERMAVKRAMRVLEAAGVSGYTVLPAMAGYGNGTRWQRDTDISGSRDMVVIVAIMDEALVEKSMAQIQSLLGEHVGVVSVSQVAVLRPDRF